MTPLPGLQHKDIVMFCSQASCLKISGHIHSNSTFLFCFSLQAGSRTQPCPFKGCRVSGNQAGGDSMLTQEQDPEGTAAVWASEPRCMWKGSRVDLTGRYLTLLTLYPRPVASKDRAPGSWVSVLNLSSSVWVTRQAVSQRRGTLNRTLCCVLAQ